MKKKTLKKLMAVILASAMAMSVAACGNDEADNQSGSRSGQSQSEIGGEANGGSTNPVSDVPVTFTFMYSGEYNPEFKSLKKMTELTNVTLEVTAIPDSDYDTRNQLVINTGEDMPDLISKTKPKAAQALSGVLLPISDYYDQMPNFMKFIEDNDLQYLIENARQSDGKVYELPVNTKEVKTASKQMFVRKDVFDKNNIPIPTTYDELYEALKKLKEIYPESQPAQVIYGNGNLLDMIAPAFGTSGGWGMGIDNFHYVEEKDEWVYAPTSDEYKVMLEYLHKLYAEGLLNQEYTTYNGDMYKQNATTGIAFFLFSDWMGCEQAFTEALREAGEEDAEWIPIYPLAGPAGTYISRVGNSSQTMVISAAAAEKDYFPALIKWLDWMYSEEAINLFTWGIEGETYTIDADGNKVFDPTIKNAAQPDGTWEYGKEYGTGNNCFTFVYPYDYDVATSKESYKELAAKEKEDNVIPNPEPSLPLTEEEIEIQSLYNTNLNDYVDQMITKFIMGSESLDNWDNFVKECNNKGAGTLYELYNNAWKNRK